MKKHITHRWYMFALSLATLFAPSLHAQSKAILTNAGNMKLSGTSTLHDWCMNGVFQVNGNFKEHEGTQELQSVTALNFYLPVENLKSDKKKLDETAYKALKTDEHKDIVFKLSTATVRKVKQNHYMISGLGNLTIAGVTKSIAMNVNWFIQDDQTILCTGIQKLKMTDYQVKPPGFLGVMKTGDEITLDFSFQIKS